MFLTVVLFKAYCEVSNDQNKIKKMLMEQNKKTKQFDSIISIYNSAYQMKSIKDSNGC